MRRDWQPEELIDCWTLVDRDWELVANKSGATRLGFALLLKFFDLEGRFPAHAEELPPTAVQYVAGLVKVAPSELVKYEWSGRAIKYHRAQIREASAFREPGRVRLRRAVRTARRRGVSFTARERVDRVRAAAGGLCLVDRQRRSHRRSPAPTRRSGRDDFRD